MKKERLSLPTPQELRDYINQNGNKISLRDIAKAFGIKGQAHIALKAAVKELRQVLDIRQQEKRGAPVESSLLKTVRIVQITDDGDVVGVLEEAPEQEITIGSVLKKFQGRASLSQLGVGDYAQIKIEETSACLVRKLNQKEDLVLGVFHATQQGNLVTPVSRTLRENYVIASADTAGAQNGDLVEIRPISLSHQSQTKGQVVRVLGSMREPRSMSLIAIHSYALPSEFSKAAMDLAEKATIPPLAGREDLRDIPLVTIDDEDARDFDDAVWAAPDPDLHNPGGWHIIVAIADVSHYVHLGDALDEEAFQRGNSVYFPDHVIPMLPEALSNHICSLKPEEDRACLAVHLKISKKGLLLSHRFVRGLMRSVQRLTYQETQDAFEGKQTRLEKKFIEDIIVPLYGAYHALGVQKAKRSPLNLDLPEERIYLDEEGKISKISPRPRFDSHRLIEEFMITANIAAAITLDEKKTLCMYRIHDKPTPEKLDALRNFLQGMQLSFPKGQVPLPHPFNQLIAKARHKSYEHAVHELILRTQAQAIYHPDNIGHFGLNLPRYAHFTSPIRRYADLLVHRGLVAALDLPGEPEFPYVYEQFKSLGEHISMTERRAVSAERETIERYISAYLSQDTGKSFSARITGVTAFALFIRLDQSGAEGMIPMRLLGSDYFIHDPVHHQLVGRRTKKIYKLGEKIKVTLVNADPVKGSIIFAAVVSPKKAFRSRKTNAKTKTLDMPPPSTH